MKLLGLALALGAVLSGPRAAKVEVGDLAPEIYGEWYLSDASSLEEVRGRVILLDFWRTW
jgi:hypothetical protein